MASLSLRGEAARVDDDEPAVGSAADAVAPIARQTGVVRDQRVARGRQAVEQRRFADVGPADERHGGQHGVAG